MQGYANKYDLPRPYAMKPKRHGADKIARNYFTTPQRKLLGYLLLFGLFSLVILQCLPEKERDKTYELDVPDLKLVKDPTVVKKGSSKRPLDDDYSADYESVLSELESAKASTGKSSKQKSIKDTDELEEVDEITEEDLIDGNVVV